MSDYEVYKRKRRLVIKENGMIADFPRHREVKMLKELTWIVNVIHNVLKWEQAFRASRRGVC
eukprot:scaffold157380_cov18-Tisochrysis_lutea.AAC.1